MRPLRFQNDFVEADPSYVFRDGSGSFFQKLTHYPVSTGLAFSLNRM